MEEWLDRLADALEEPRIDPAELGAVLKLAREVAHGVERRFAPVSAFLLGVAVGAGTAGGVARNEAFARAVTTVRELVPEIGEREDEA
jgi:Domain of unknown function (DUF6457)